MTSPAGDADAGLSIRRARVDDAPEVARLAGELGYPGAADQMRQRLETIGASSDHAVFAAERGACAVGEPGACAGRSAAPLLGWIHVARRILLESGECAEIVGLVVVVGARRAGVGRRLVAAAEQWSRSLALQRIVVRSNAVRTESHEFYPALDYALAKSQRVYVKQLG